MPVNISAGSTRDFTARKRQKSGLEVTDCAGVWRPLGNGTAQVPQLHSQQRQSELSVHEVVARQSETAREGVARMNASECVLYSGGLKGAEAAFGAAHDRFVASNPASSFEGSVTEARSAPPRPATFWTSSTSIRT